MTRLLLIVLAFVTLLVGNSLAAETDLPRVLIIGDSISIGYTQPVTKLLKDVAVVKRIPGNGEATVVGLKNLDGWLGNEKWAVIHFNWGLHDMKYLNEKGEKTSADKGKHWVPLPEYEKNLQELVTRLKKTGAKLIWASTTPVPAGSQFRLAGDEAKYNEVAAKVMQENNVAINDLNAFATANVPNLPHDVHYSPQGSQKLATQVAESIRKTLAAGTTGEK